MARYVIIDNEDGMDYAVALGRNSEGRRVIFIGMREIGLEDFQPIIEMDVDSPNFYRDTRSELNINPVGDKT